MTKNKTISNIKFRIANYTLFKHFFMKLKGDPFPLSSPEKHNYYCNHIFNYKYDCTNPRTFNEYVAWIKYNYKNELWDECADKLKCKQFLKEKGFEKYLPDTLGVYHNINEIKLDLLPDKFVLKTNHDSGSVFICDKQSTDFNEVFKKIDESIHKIYSNENGEWVYENIEPLIFAEELLMPYKGNDLFDYKFQFVNQQFVFGFCCLNREKDIRFYPFDKDFKKLDGHFLYLAPSRNEMPNKPENYEEMMNIGKELSKYFEMVRVDFYSTTNGVIIGELTFFTQSGAAPFTCKKYDFEFGKAFEKTSFYALAHNKK